MFESIVEGMLLVLTWKGILAVAGGVCAGLILGAIPGLTAAMAIALLVPLTFYTPIWISVPLLLGMLKGSFFGGSISAILIRTPGTPAAAATVLDGYPLAQQGKSGKALKMALYSSVFGDTFSDICLVLVAGMLARIALKFGPPEYTLLIAFSLLLIGGVSGKSITKGIITAGIGLLISCIGMDPLKGHSRLIFNSIELLDGIQLVPMLIGLLAVSEILLQMSRSKTDMHESIVPISQNPADNRVSWAEFCACVPTLIKSSVIGTIIGALPGLGGTVAAFLSYGEAQRSSKNRSLFGKGALEGIAAAESANSAVCGANMIPLLAFGIPGDVTAAIILGAFLMQGITPGPLIFREVPVAIYAIYTGLLLGNIFNMLFGYSFLRLTSYFVRIPKRILFPCVLVTAVAGSYGFRHSMFDVKTMVVFGIIGYVLSKLEYPLVPMIIAFILGPILESSLRRTLLIIKSEGSVLFLLQRPLFIVLSAVAIFCFYFFYRQYNLLRNFQE